ncbi:hypothetical protein Lesp02_23400 [Lentzea sp. NBRC 105346]|uniref:DUF7617 domain-containing protein n=1 Tax=Lentzea sp. NBRC 105346 TaxID=3032205 RepID=UPI0024A0D894|nr:hypothetical protein [Lentzea sp. NBRC 105346]GLZ30150.1 hypothetical protein Lesp02_23400 [Lentzea sp. NBRC 105346]
MPARRGSRVLRSVTRLLVILVLVAGSATVTTGSASAGIVTPFTQVYDKVVYGDFNIIGNSVTKCPATASPLTSVPCSDGANRIDTDAVNDEYAMAWADIDSNPATFDSSSASVTVPPGATIDYVRLYWAGDTGRYTDSDGTLVYPLCSGNGLSIGEYATPPPGTPQTQSVSVRLGTGTTTAVAPQTFVNEPVAALTEAQYYSASAEITSLFSGASTGSPITVTVGNVWTPEGYNCFGGWSLTLVYTYPQPEPTYAPVPREIFIYDGHVRQDSLQPPTTVPISGFRYPGGPLRAGVTAYEGDWGISGDQFLINGTPIAEPTGTGSGNFFVDSAAGPVNPNTPNNFSVDAKDFVLPAGTVPVGANSLTLQLNTTGDSYLAQQVAFSVPLPTLNVVKEVCTSTTPANCGSGGTGPWAENTLIPSGSTAYWRIKVSNPTTVDIPGVTLNDPAAPSCVTAAGTFTVLAGQTLTFYCSSPNLTTALVNSVTARFVPLSAPAGSPPVDTAPDTARADVHALTIAKQVCSSLVAADCGAGGAGPWVELATIPAGTTVRWKITVTNTGSVDLTGITINDAAHPACATGPFSVAAGASASFYCSTANVAAGSTNTVTAQYTPPGLSQVVTAPDDARVRVSRLTVAKEVCGSSLAADCVAGGTGPWQENLTASAGSAVYWRITVANTGEADLTAIALNDAAEASCAVASFDLTAGATKTFYCSTANVSANRTNTATAQYVPPGAPAGTAPVVTAPDGATVNVYGLVLAKEVCSALTGCASGPWVETANLPSGSTAYWRITATNTGDVNLTGVTLNDPAEASCVTSFDLAVSASKVFYCSTANVTTGRTNTVTATYTPPGGSQVSTAPDSATVKVTNLAVVKDICTGVGCSDSATLPTGSTAQWRITVTNTGEVDLTGIVLNDPGEASCVVAPFDLAVNESKTVNCSTANLSVNKTNTATAQYLPPGAPSGTEPIVTAPDSATATVFGLVVAKEVCSSLIAADCASAGPWVETANIPSGSTAYWRITATNTGDVDLTGVTLNDPSEASCITSFDLAAGATKTFHCTTTTVTAGLTNTVTATYTPPGGSQVTTVPDSATVKVTNLAVVKDICTGVGCSDTATLPTGSTAQWQITVTNTGEVDLTGITLNDPGEASCVVAPFDLAVNESKTVNCSTANVTTNKTNTATAQYLPPGAALGTEPVVSAPDSATATVFGLVLAKEVCSSLVAADCASTGPWVETANIPSGTTAYWRITATNTGDVDLTAITLNDPAEATCVTSFDLAVSASKVFYCSTANVTTGRTNTVTATYTPPGGTEVTTVPDSATVKVTNLTVAKDICTATDCGDTATLPTGSTAQWQITVTNTGEVDLTGITLNDAAEASCVAAPFDLAVNESKTVNCSTANLSVNKTNTVTAQYLPPGAPLDTEPVVSGPDSATATVFGLVLAKEACASATCGSWVETANIPSGSTAYWRITATNTGDVGLTGIVLNDAAEPGCATAAGSFDLIVGELKTFYCSTAGVTDSVTNTVTATFTPPGGALQTTAPDSATVKVTNLAVAKEVCTAVDCSGTTGPWAETANLPSGSTAQWRITVTNTGDVDLTGITLDDPAEASCVTSFDLAVDESKAFYCSTANVTTGRTNTVTAQYVPPGSGTPATTPPDSATVVVTNLAVDKEVCTDTDCGDGPWSDTASLMTGSTAYWRITVTNTGEIGLTGIALNDPVEASCAGASFDLAVNESKTVNCSTTNLTTNTTNSATAQYVPPGAPPSTEPVVTAPASATANVYGLELVKEVCASLSDTDCGPGGPGPWGLVANIPSGSSVHWRITATNTGDVDLTGVTLTDADEPSCDTVFDLAVGASASFYCSTDGVTGSVTNEVTATFGMMGWPDVTEDAEASVNVTDLQVQKEICSSLTAADCGTGPWVDTATLPKGATAHWRITVTNSGDVDLTGIVVNDPAEPSCVPAAFDLAKGASKVVYCSTANVTATKTNAVTAAYVPPGSPPSTPPIVTAPADATAKVSDLLVRKDICQSADCTTWGDDHVIQRGGTARWRITVTNTGEVDLTGIMLDDAVEPSCSTGGIDLAAGASTTFTCSTTNVTAGMTNTVTGQYVPPGAPATTPPLSTPPDDARVRVADLTVRKEVCLAGACDLWGELVTVHSGGTADWRITVVNTGEVDLGEVTVQDAIEPGCVTPAFALASGAEKTVYCATAGLTAGVVNTATATYSLPGEPPVVIPPDSASAEVAPTPIPPASAPLAVTGDDIWPLLAIGLLLVGAGVLLRVFARRRA